MFFFTFLLQLFGDDHPRTKRGLGTINEPTYARIAQAKGDVWPPTPPDYNQ